MTNDRLERLRIASEQKRRSSGSLWFIFAGALAITGVALYFAIPRATDDIRTGMTSSGDAAPGKIKKKKGGDAAGTAMAKGGGGTGAAAATAAASGMGADASATAAPRVPESLFRAVGYIIARERIELSPRFMGIVKWIGVRKGDTVTNGQVVVRLDDAEYTARLAENDGMVANAEVAVKKATLDLHRAEELVSSRVEMQKFLDDARLALASAEAQLKQVRGSRLMIQRWIDWCTITSPVDGVVLERLVDANELVTPQTFGGGRGPSTSLLAVADLTDLQVEVDVGDRDLAKVKLGQACKVIPDAYKDRQYDGVVAEIAPEASRQKGTLQIKVRIEKPDRFLTPELGAEVYFLGSEAKQ